jgi:hypothetical protein
VFANPHSEIHGLGMDAQSLGVDARSMRAYHLMITLVKAGFDMFGCDLYVVRSIPFLRADFARISHNIAGR